MRREPWGGINTWREWDNRVKHKADKRVKP